MIQFLHMNLTTGHALIMAPRMLDYVDIRIQWLIFCSNFSPVPKRVMDGSEQGEVVAAAVLSGAPVDLQARQVR